MNEFFEEKLQVISQNSVITTMPDCRIKKGTICLFNLCKLEIRDGYTSHILGQQNIKLKSEKAASHKI